MSRPMQILGERFGRLVVIAQSVGDGRCSRWACRCDCGRIRIARGADLRNGYVKSCGCLRKESAKVAQAASAAARKRVVARAPDTGADLAGLWPVQPRSER